LLKITDIIAIKEAYDDPPSVGRDNKKSQLTLSNPRDVKACKNCS